jgi:hypothetical protein
MSLLPSANSPNVEHACVCVCAHSCHGPLLGPLLIGDDYERKG